VISFSPDFLNDRELRVPILLRTLPDASGCRLVIAGPEIPPSLLSPILTGLAPFSKRTDAIRQEEKDRF